MNTPISQNDLHAFADRQLNPARMRQIELFLADHPEQHAQIEEWREQARQIHQAFDSVLNEPVPNRLIAAANLPRWRHARKLAVVLWLMLGSVAGFVLRGEIGPNQLLSKSEYLLPHQAAIAHAVFTPEVRHAVEVGGDQEAHLVSWLSKRLGAELKPPKLDAAGYRLIGGRLLPGENGKAAQFMYENEAHNRLTLYVQPNSAQAANTEFRYAREENIDVFFWVDGRFGYALSGNTGREAMLRLANLVYHH